MLVAGLWIATMAIGKTASTAAQAAGGAAEATAGAAGGASASPQGRAQVQDQANRAEQQVQGMAQKLGDEKEEAAAAAKTAGAAGAWAFFLYGVLTLAAAVLGGRTGVPRSLLERRVPRAVAGDPLPHRA
jgi:hypothetical protein